MVADGGRLVRASRADRRGGGMVDMGAVEINTSGSLNCICASVNMVPSNSWYKNLLYSQPTRNEMLANTL
jgi:hypothetical protein